MLSIYPQYPQCFQHFPERKNVDFQIDIKNVARLRIMRFYAGKTGVCQCGSGENKDCCPHYPQYPHLWMCKMHLFSFLCGCVMMKTMRSGKDEQDF